MAWTYYQAKGGISLGGSWVEQGNVDDRNGRVVATALNGDACCSGRIAMAARSWTSDYRPIGHLANARGVNP